MPDLACLHCCALPTALYTLYNMNMSVQHHLHLTTVVTQLVTATEAKARSSNTSSSRNNISINSVQ